MRSLVTSPVFLMKKKLFNFLHWIMPNTFIPLYTMVCAKHFPGITKWIFKRERERERPDVDAKMRPLLLLVTALLGKAHLECCNSVIKKV